MKISDITPGTRHRTDMGDIDALADSIDALGLLHPVVVNEAGELIAGARRLEACRRLGWKDVPATVAKNLDDVHKALLAERDENTCRKSFTPTEAAAMAEALEPFEKAAAAERKQATQDNKQSGEEKFSGPEKGRAADKVAEAVGVSRPTLAKTQAVIAAAREDPEHFADLPAKMDQSGKVEPAFQEMKERAKAHPVESAKQRQKLTPEAEAKRHAAKWCKNFAEIYQTFQSIREMGGVEKLVEMWNDADRQDYLGELREFRKTTDQLISQMEKLCRSRKTA
jgi:ParB-like chromosome segregation protein Spo0J